MPVIVDARGLACPQPVILAKKAIVENEEVTVLVDNPIAVENIRRLAEKTACGFSFADKGEGTLEIALTRKGVPDLTPSEPRRCRGGVLVRLRPGKGIRVLLWSSCRTTAWDRGDDVLGDVLIRSFIHTLPQLKPLPDTIICYNAGVKLAAKDSAVLDDLQQLAQAGVDILVCGTCVNYFALGGQIAAGHISNMYDIAETMAGASRLLRP